MGRKRNSDEQQTKKKSGASRRAAARKRQQDPPNLENLEKRIALAKRNEKKSKNNKLKTPYSNSFI
jgi:hypothetical protein